MNETAHAASVTFYGGAGSVTGANFLFNTGDARILVDCGAVERDVAHSVTTLGFSNAGVPAKKISAHVCDESNLLPFPYDPASIDALIVTHAHADHIGRIPKLVHDGFKGTIYSTPATRDLAELMFEDAIKVMSDDMREHGCAMMYRKEDAAAALALWSTHEYHKPFAIGSAEVEFFDAGHILGAAMARFTRNGRRILFTGDLGNSPEPLLKDTEHPGGVNYVVMESVYGDRLHEERGARVDILRDAIKDTIKRRGTLLIPSFSIERTQILLYEIKKSIAEGAIPAVSVYLDAPLAIKVTDVFRRYVRLFNYGVQALFKDGDDPFTFMSLQMTDDQEKSRAIQKAPDPKVIIAGAGMSAGGRIRMHEKHYLSDESATLLFVGYQAPGSLGRRIQDGEKRVTIEGEKVRVRARIRALTGFSGHRDRDGLMDFVEHLGDSLEKVFVVMGEPKSELFLAQRIRDFYDIDAVAPEQGQSVPIDW